MKLFLREHQMLMAFQVVQFFVILSVYWLAGFRDFKLILYSFFLSLCMLSLYLLYDYWTRRYFYQRISKPLESIDEALETIGDRPIAKALHQYNLSNYRLYQNQMMAQWKKQEDYAKFMDLWVHQMKTPLSVIDLTAREVEEPYSSNIRYENDKLKAGLDNVLHMSRLREVQKDFHVKNVDLIKVIDLINKDNRRYYIRNHLYPKIITEQAEVYVETDEKWLYFILTQIIHNAIKYSAGHAKEIIIKIEEIDKQIKLNVEDHGIGIPEYDLKRIFDPFYTGHNGRLYRESTGVGLYVVKEIVTYLGHEIKVESEVDKFTHFIICF